MASVEVVIPWRRGCEYREAAFEHVLELYREHYPDYLVTTAGYTGEAWIKARAVMPAIRASEAEVVVVADADVWVDKLDAAVAAVNTDATWAVPYRGVHRLSAPGTAAVYAGADWRDQGLDAGERPYLGIPGGGVVVAGRETLLTCPLDPRFIGWGQEDESWGVALETLFGPPRRIKGALIHFYHPPQERLSRSRGSIDGWELRKRYVKARGNLAAMTALLQEAATVGTS